MCGSLDLTHMNASMYPVRLFTFFLRAPSGLALTVLCLCLRLYLVQCLAVSVSLFAALPVPLGPERRHPTRAGPDPAVSVPDSHGVPVLLGHQRGRPREDGCDNLVRIASCCPSVPAPVSSEEQSLQG